MQSQVTYITTFDASDTFWIAIFSTDFYLLGVFWGFFEKKMKGISTFYYYDWLIVVGSSELYFL